MNSFHKFIFLAKGVYLFYKIIEIWKIYFDEYKFCESNMDIKEKIFFKNFRAKSFLELGGLVYVFFQLSSCFIMGDSTPLYFNVVMCYFIFILGFHILTYFKKYKEITGYLKGLESCLETAEIQEDKECIIIHLCRSEINFRKKVKNIIRNRINMGNNNENNNEQNTKSIFPFNINYNLFS